jgi:hypothetical protein
MEKRRMALGLMVLSSMISLPIALAAWLLGYATFGQAAIVYMGVGWAMMALGCLTSMPGSAPRARAAAPRGRSVVIDVTVANGN